MDPPQVRWAGLVRTRHTRKSWWRWNCQNQLKRWDARKRHHASAIARLALKMQLEVYSITVHYSLLTQHAELKLQCYISHRHTTVVKRQRWMHYVRPFRPKPKTYLVTHVRCLRALWHTNNITAICECALFFIEQILVAENFNENKFTIRGVRTEGRNGPGAEKVTTMSQVLSSIGHLAPETPLWARTWGAEQVSCPGWGSLNFGTPCLRSGTLLREIKANDIAQ